MINTELVISCTLAYDNNIHLYFNKKSLKFLKQKQGKEKKKITSNYKMYQINAYQ